MKYTFRPTLVTTLITLIIFSALLNLGFWQLNRAEFKKLLNMQYFERSQTAITAATLNTKQENLRFFKIQLTGRFDNDHTVFLPHNTQFIVFTPFNIFGATKMILVERGTVPNKDSKTITPIFGEQEIAGILDDVPQKLNFTKLSQDIKKDFYPYIIISHNAATLPIQAKSQEHVIYAMEWFGLSLLLLLFFVISNIRKNNSAFESDFK